MNFMPVAARRTGNDIMHSVSAVTCTITHGANSISALAEAGSLRAEQYRDDTKAEIQENAAKRRIKRCAAAKVEVAEELIAIQERLEENPKLLEMFNNLNDDDFTFKP